MKLYHNPRCSKSREGLQLLEGAGCEVEIVEYMKAAPTKEELAEILEKLGMKAEDLVRKNEAVYKEKFKGKKKNKCRLDQCHGEIPSTDTKTDSNRWRLKPFLGRPRGRLQTTPVTLAKRERRKKSECFNCGSKLRANDNFCSNCGQENHDKKVPVSLLLNDFAGDYLTFDSKVFRSLYSVIFKPGLLSAEYADGKRTRYVKPIRLFLFISFIYFLLLNLMAQDSGVITTTDGGGGSGFNFTLGDRTDNDEVPEMTSTFLDSLNAVIADPQSTPEEKLSASNMKMETIAANDEFVRTAMKAFSYCFIVMAPLLAAIFLLFFHRKRKYYMEHLVLSLNVHSVMFVLLILALGVSYFFPDISYLNIGVFIVMLVHTGFAMHRMYQSNWGYISLVITLALILYFILFVIVLLGAIYLSLLVFRNEPIKKGH